MLVLELFILFKLKCFYHEVCTSFSSGAQTTLQAITHLDLQILQSAVGDKYSIQFTGRKIEIE